jgi:manganese/iron transport system substrate-binding protein
MMLRPIALLSTLLALPLALAAACADDGEPPGDERRLRVVATVAPITSLVENIGGTRISLEGLVPQGTDSHTYEPPVSAVRLLAEAGLIVLNGLQLEEPVLRLAEANKKEGAVILLLGDETITPEQYKFDFSFPREGGAPNPHVWPDPVLVMNYATLIYEHLAELDPKNADYYETNYKALMQRLEDLHRAMQTATQTVPPQNRRLLTYHDSWPYWAERYGFEVIGAIQPSDFSEPSAREVARIIDQIREAGIPAIFGSELFPSPILEQIARETGAEFHDGLEDDELPGEPGDPNFTYIGMMVENMRIMIPALGGDAAPMDTVQTGLVFSDGPSPARYP